MKKYDINNFELTNDSHLLYFFSGGRNGHHYCYYYSEPLRRNEKWLESISLN